MKIKKFCKKIGMITLSFLMMLSCVNLQGFQDVKALTLNYQGKSGISKSVELNDVWGMSGTHGYKINIGDSAGFCLDFGKAMKKDLYLDRKSWSGVSESTETKKAMNYYYSNPSDYSYWVAATLIWGYQLGKISSPLDGENFQPGIGYTYTASAEIFRVMTALDIPLPPGYAAMGQIAETLKEVDKASSDGAFYLYEYSSGYQRVATNAKGYVPTYNLSKVESTKTYSITDNIELNIDKKDVDTSNGLGNVQFDLYRDEVKIGTVTTDSQGKANYTFEKKYTESGTARKTYCDNYDELSPDNKKAVGTVDFTSKSAAQKEADKVALANAKKLVNDLLAEKHTYKAVETKTRQEYYLNPTSTTQSKEYASGDGTGSVTFSYTNKRQLGKISITKLDEETNIALDGFSYVLKANETINHPDGHTGVLYNKGDVVGTFPTTDVNGHSELNDLYMGKYTVEETNASTGYVKSSRVYEVELTSTNNDVSIIDTSTNVYDKVQRARVDLVKEDKELHNGTQNSSIVDGNNDGAQGDATRQNATYGLYAENDIVHADGKTGVVQYNSTVGSINELKATKGKNLSVKNVKATAGTLLATIQTDENGEFGFEHLYNGLYYVQEIDPSTGYLLDTTKYTIDLRYTNQDEEVISKTQTVLEQVKKQGFDLQKIGHSAGTSGVDKPLGNVVFTVWLESDIQRLMNTGLTLAQAKEQAPVYDRITTNDKGQGFSNVEFPYGYYRVGETTPAVDYATADDFFVNITEDNRTHQHYTDKIITDEIFSAMIKAVKLDKETGKQVALPNTEFKIKVLSDEVYVDGEKFVKGEYIGYWNWNIFDGFYTDSWKTNKDGYVLINEKLSAGEYQLEEIHAPFGYVLDTTPIKFKVTNQGMYQIADDGKTPIITTYKSDVSVKGQITLSKKGEVLTDFQDGQFVYEERGLSNAEYGIYADEDILDPSNDGTVLFAKDTLVDTVTTGADGKGTSNKLPLGKYYSKELKAPHGFTVSDEVLHFELTYVDENTELVFDDGEYTNERQKVNANIQKVDEKENTIGLSGAEFDFIASEDIYNVDNELIVAKGTVLSHYISDVYGDIQIKQDLPLDYNFELVETKAPDGYVLDETPVTFNTDYQGQDIEIIQIKKTKENERTHVDFSKIDVTTSKELAGNQMKIFEKDNEGATFEIWISGDKPHTVENLSIDTRYILRETSAVKGFYLANDIEFEIDKYGNVYIFDEDGNKQLAEDNLIVMENDLVKGKLEWNKQGTIFTYTDNGQTEFGSVQTPVWEVSNLLQSDITIYAGEDITLGNNETYYKKDQMIEKLESDLDSVQSIELLVGKYYYVETRTPHGYVRDTDKHYFEVKDNQSSELQIITSTLENERPKVNIEFTKFMETFTHHNKLDNAYKDVVFGIFAREDIYTYKGSVGIENGTMVATTGIDELGQLISVPDLPNGVYYLKELQTNDDYVLDTNEYDFEIAYHGEDVSEYTVVIGNGDIENKLVRGNIEVRKHDIDDETKILKDVEFNISADKDMIDVISTAKTDDKGVARFEDMEIGEYYIQEAKQVDGYTFNDTIYKVEITTNGEVLTIDVNNKPTEMEFTKVDETGVNELEGAKVEIIDKETGGIVDSWISTKEPHKIKYLVEGKEYIFKETSAPYGYEISEEIVFTAKDGVKVTMKDMPILTDIQVNKVDSQTMQPIVSKDFEFTMYADEKCTQVLDVVKADQEDGTATFKDVRFGTVYIKETKAPKGYELSSEVKKIVIDQNLEGVGEVHSFVYLNTLLPTTIIKTDDNTMIAGTTLLLCASIIGMIATKKKKKETE